MKKIAEKPSFVYVTHIATTPKKLWKALTGGSFLPECWYGARFQTSWKVGSKMQTITPEGKVDWDGRVLEFDPPRRLSYTFQIVGYQKKSSRLVFELAPQGKMVKLTLTHYGIERRCVKGISGGWSAFCSTLKTKLETGRPLPFK